MTTLAPPATPSLGSAAAPSFARAQSLAAQIADFIVDGIAGGTYAFGQRLIETELAARLKVSRVPMLD